MNRKVKGVLASRADAGFNDAGEPSCVGWGWRIFFAWPAICRVFIVRSIIFAFFRIFLLMYVLVRRIVLA